MLLLLLFLFLLPLLPSSVRLCLNIFTYFLFSSFFSSSFCDLFYIFLLLGNSVISDRDRQSLQEGLPKISAWSDRWEMPFNINKWHILQVGTRNNEYEYEMGGLKLGSVHCVKDLGVTVTSNLKFSQDCKEAACKANKMLGFINRNFSFKNKDIILPMCTRLSQTPFGVCGVILVASPYKGHSKIRSHPV